MRDQILEQAKTLISTDRADQYGDARDTHYRIGLMWEALLGEPECTCCPPVITPADVALMMICVKIVRAKRNPSYADSWIDIAGYAALGAEMSAL